MPNACLDKMDGKNSQRTFELLLNKGEVWSLYGPRLNDDVTFICVEGTRTFLPVRKHDFVEPHESLTWVWVNSFIFYTTFTKL